MKKLIAALMIISLCIGLIPMAYASGFSEDADAIEKATQSVLKLTLVNENDLDIVYTGSGFIAFNSRTLITNYHVIEGTTHAIASGDDGKVYDIGYVLCADQKADIAILELEESTGLAPLELYPDDHLKRGARVVAIGSPEGITNTVSTGIISNIGVDDDNHPTIQITAPISHGSSGGPLFNDDGKVIGVNTSILTSGQNINYAMNISLAQAMYNAWDGRKYSLANSPSSAKMDFAGVYQHKGAVEKEDKPEEKVDTAEDRTVEENRIIDNWICPQCNTENNTKFCLECGTEKPYWICSCGRENSSNKFCGDCGRGQSEQLELFNAAMDAASQHDYQKAINSLTDLGLYDSGSYETVAGKHAAASHYINKLYYDEGIYLQSINADHEKIIECFRMAGDYGDSREQIQAENARYSKQYYDLGNEQLANGEYESALESFKTAGDYQDSGKKVQSVYYAWGEKLLNEKQFESSREKFGLAGDYEDAQTMIQKSYYVEATDKLAGGKRDEAIALFEKAGDYPGAAEELKQLIDIEKKQYYEAGKKALDVNDYNQAKQQFKLAFGYLDADALYEKANVLGILETYGNNDHLYLLSAEREALIQYAGKLKHKTDDKKAVVLYKQIYYVLGKDSLKRGNNNDVMEQFAEAGDYKDAAALLIEARKKEYEQYIQYGNYNKAYEYYIQYLVPLGYEQEHIIVNIGDKGYFASEVLGLARALGSKGIPENEDEYSDKYAQFVQDMEEYFGLNPDGKIVLSEYLQIKEIIYPGIKKPKVKALLEKLVDLKYIKKLPEEHDVYDKKYKQYVVAAEKKLKLKADGIVTKEEYETIMTMKK